MKNLSLNVIFQIPRQYAAGKYCHFPIFFLLVGIFYGTLSSANAGASNDSGDGPVRKKLIEIGWDSPDSKSLVKNLAQMETTPFDGVGIKIKIRGNSEEDVNFQGIFNATQWKREWFQNEIDTLRKVKSKKLTDNFLLVGPGPALDWFDDAGWSQVVDHFRIAAWIAKQSGLKGIIFDPELGVSRQPAFHYKDQISKSNYSFAEYASKVRQRGREVMQAMGEEYPDMTFFTLFMHSGMALASFGEDPREGIETKAYSLYPAFINGWLDALPPQMKIVDGNESSYPHSNELQYLKRVNGTRNGSLSLIASENQKKYRSQVQASIALYMDAFVNFPKSNVHADVFTDPPLNGESLVTRIQDAVTFARESSEEYVWVWDEMYRWWPTDMPLVKPQHWDDILPGSSAALQDGMNSEKAALTRANEEFSIMEQKGKFRAVPLHNLIKNGDFNNGALNTKRPATNLGAGNGKISETGDTIADWHILQEDSSTGILNADAVGCSGWGSARITKAKCAAYTQIVEVSPFTFYKFRVKIRQMGEGDAEVRLQWLNSAGDRLDTTKICSLVPKGSPRQGWVEASDIIKAPYDAKKLIVELTAANQKSSDDVIWYDDVELYRIDYN